MSASVPAAHPTPDPRLASAAHPTSDPRLVLDAHLVVDRGPFRLDLPLRVGAGEVVALLGPNGAGKTTALRALAGLTPITAGYVRINGVDLDRPADRVLVPTAHRPVGVVFQDHLLFPHLDARDNVAFGLRRHGLDRRTARRYAIDWLTRVGLAGQARHRPRQLSGGQAQRVALARALAVRPHLLLLDEPLAALDARTRLEIRTELHRHLGDHPGAVLLITHDPLDALVLADRLVIIEQGRIVQEGDPTEISTRPRTDYVARLVGLNLHRATADGHRAQLGGGLCLPLVNRLDGEVLVAFPPSMVALHDGPPADSDSPAVTWPAVVTTVQRHGDNLRVRLDGPLEVAADVTPATVARLRLAPGRSVRVSVPLPALHVYPSR